jgi:secondary thiamine-phosphate synthase enzyme
VTIYRETLEIRTQARGLIDVTGVVAKIVERAKVTAGLCHVFVQHTSASLVIQENADPSVLRDLARWVDELAPEARTWEHDAEGPDDMPAHAKSAITRTSETIPVVEGRLGLGTWQALYLWEHRALSHVRRLVVTIQG